MDERQGQKLVPFSQRRHRLNPNEVSPVLEAVDFRLKQLVHDREDLPSAMVLLRVYYRLKEHVTARPKYPAHKSWAEIIEYL